MSQEPNISLEINRFSFIAPKGVVWVYVDVAVQNQADELFTQVKLELPIPYETSSTIQEIENAAVEKVNALLTLKDFSMA